MVANFGLIVLCISLGILFKRTGRLPVSSPIALNGFILNVSLPAVALLSLHEITLSRDLFFPVAMAWILFIAGWLFFTVLGSFAGWRRETLGALILTGALSNTSFVGFPLLTALYGPESLRVGVLTDQPGSFLVLSSLGVWVATTYAARKTSLANIPKKLLRFPPFIAMLVAIGLHPWAYPEAFKEVLQKLAATLIPLALVSVGMQMGLSTRLLKNEAPRLAAGLFYKLLLGPGLIYVLYVLVLGARGQDIQITIVQAAMAPMITGAILAADHGLEPELANLMIGVGIPLSLLTVPFWAYLLRAL